MSKPQKGFGLIPALLVVVLVGAFIGVGWYVWNQNQDKKVSITNFDECVAAGNPVMLSYPGQCSANGQTFTQELTDEEKETLIPPNSSRLYEKRFRIDLPEGWKFIQGSGDIANESDGAEMYEFRKDGSYLKVNMVTVSGKDGGGDLYWQYEVNQDNPGKITLSDKSEKLCSRELEAYCQVGDDELQIFVGPGDSQLSISGPLGVPVVTFFAGNSTSEDLDNKLINELEAIIESMEFKLGY